MPSIPFALVSRLCLIDAFFRRLSPSSFAAPPSLFPPSFTLRLARTLRSTPCLAREESFHPACDNARFYRLPLSAAFVLSTLPYRRRFVLVPLQHALLRLSSFIQFTPVSSTFSTFPSSRFNQRASVSASRALSAIVFLSPSLKPPSVSLQRHSLRRDFLLQPTVLSLYLSPLPCPGLSLSRSHPLAISHQLTHTLRRRQAPVPCGLVLRARGCCEIIVAPRPSRNQPPRVTPR